MPVEHLKLIFKFKSSVINKFSKMIDQKVEELICLEDFRDSSSKDTLFELIMMRFDEMKIYKKSLKLILQESKKKPVLISTITKNVVNTMDFYLQLSNSYKNRPLDIFKKNFLFIIYSLSFRIWLDDETNDLSKTMAELDRLLSMAKNFQKQIRSLIPI